MKKPISLVKSLILLLILCASLTTIVENVSAAWIEVTFPSASSTLDEGSTYEITWSSYDVGSYVYIYLYEGGYYYSTISSSAYNDGSYSWTVPSGLSSSYSYQIKIVDYYDTSVYDLSSYFYVDVTDPYIEVSFVSSGSTIDEGSTYEIKWSSYDVGSYVYIYLYESGSYYSTISSYEYNDGSYYWTVPSGLSSSYSYQIKIVDYYDGNVYDLSSYFYVDVAEASIEVTFLPYGDYAYEYSSYEITWSSNDVGDYVSIYLYEGGSYHSTIETYVYNDGSYYWTVPSGLSSYDYYQIKIADYYDSNVYDLSNYFYTYNEGGSGNNGFFSPDPFEDVCITIIVILIILVILAVIYKYYKNQQADAKKKKEEKQKIEDEQRRVEKEKERQRKEEEGRRREKEEQDKQKVKELKKRIQKMKDEGYDVEELEKELESYKKD